MAARAKNVTERAGKKLTADKNGLRKQLEEVRQKQNIHSRKGRDPNEANSMSLLKEEQIAEPERVHMMRDAIKDWGMNWILNFYPPLNLQTFDPVKGDKMRKNSKKRRNRRRYRGQAETDDADNSSVA